MRVAVIIPNLHGPVIDEVIAAVLAQESPASVEVWVIGQDRYGRIPSLPQVHSVVTPEPVYPGAARNLGAAHAVGEAGEAGGPADADPVEAPPAAVTAVKAVTAVTAFVFLDADCIPQPGWLAALLEAWQAYPHAGAISGAMLPQSDTFLLHCGQIANFHEHLTLSPAGKRQTLASFSLLVPRTAWEQLGGFNPHLRHAEDMDFTLRLRAKGWDMAFEPRASVYHRHARGTWRQFWSYARRGGLWSIQVRQHYAASYSPPFWARWAWAWQLLSPFIAAARTLQIYLRAPRLWRYLPCAPWVFLQKVAWCLGAAQGLRRAPPDLSFS